MASSANLNCSHKPEDSQLKTHKSQKSKKSSETSVGKKLLVLGSACAALYLMCVGGHRHYFKEWTFNPVPFRAFIGPNQNQASRKPKITAEQQAYLDAEENLKIKLRALREANAEIKKQIDDKRSTTKTIPNLIEFGSILMNLQSPETRDNDKSFWDSIQALANGESDQKTLAGEVIAARDKFVTAADEFNRSRAQ